MNETNAVPADSGHSVNACSPLDNLVTLDTLAPLHTLAPLATNNGIDYLTNSENKEATKSIELQEVRPSPDLCKSDLELMPPPPPPEVETVDLSKKCVTPLAAMRPLKYANVNVVELFPDFREDKVGVSVTIEFLYFANLLH